MQHFCRYIRSLCRNPQRKYARSQHDDDLYDSAVFRQVRKYLVYGGAFELLYIYRKRRIGVRACSVFRKLRLAQHSVALEYDCSLRMPVMPFDNPNMEQVQNRIILFKNTAAYSKKRPNTRLCFYFYLTKSNSAPYICTVSPSLMPAFSSILIAPHFISALWKYCKDS